MGAWGPEGPAERVGAISVDVLADPLSEVEDDVVQGTGGPTRRQLLVGGAALLAGGAAWWFNRAPAGETQPAVPPAGVRPRWTHRDTEVLAAEWLSEPPALPLFLTRSELLSLDPATGAVRRRIRLPGAEALAEQQRPGSRVVVGADRVYDTTVGHLASYHLADADADWELTAPQSLGGESASWSLDCCDQAAVYGWVRRRGSGIAGLSDLFALSTRTRELLWSRPGDEQGGYLSDVQAAPGGRLVARSTRDELVALNAADGSRLWVVPADQALGWRATDGDNVYLAQRGDGLRAVRLSDGGSRWSLTPGQGESWRCLKPLPAAGAVYVPRDSGLLTRNSAVDGREVWSCQLPFRLDSRSRPVLVGETLFVPGPAAGGVCAVDTANGTIRWTFRDSVPGVQVWTLGTDGRRVFAGHDTCSTRSPFARYLSTDGDHALSGASRPWGIAWLITCRRWAGRRAQSRAAAACLMASRMRK